MIRARSLLVLAALCWVAPATAEPPNFLAKASGTGRSTKCPKERGARLPADGPKVMWAARPEPADGGMSAFEASSRSPEIFP